MSADQAWVFVDGSTTGLEMEQVIVKERPEAAREQPTMPFEVEEPTTAEAEKVSDGYRAETFDADEGTVRITWPANLFTQSVEDMKN